MGLIVSLQIIVDNLNLRVLNVMTLNQEEQMKTIKLFCARTNKYLATIADTNKAMNQWCDANGYLPHRKVKGGWMVIA